MTLSEAASWLNVPENRLAEWCKRGQIKYFRPSPGVYLFIAEQLWDFLRAKEHQRTSVQIKRAAKSPLSMTREGR
jgi:predicted site-specific integrase-resolvase